MSKKDKLLNEDELRPEYDFSKLSGAVRGKYAEKYRDGTNIVHLDADVAAVFRTEKAVNDVLRSLIHLAKSQVESLSS